MEPMRIPTPCRENLDAMPRTADGAHCARCDRDVVDLRRTAKKRALAVIADLRARHGQVCVRVRATRDGVPVFAKDPSPFARLTLPMALAGSLAACAPSAGADRDTTPVAMLSTVQQPVNHNEVSAVAPLAVPVSNTSPLPPQQPGVVPVLDLVDVAGGMVFAEP